MCVCVWYVGFEYTHTIANIYSPSVPIRPEIFICMNMSGCSRMYVCMYVCMYACKYVCVCVCVCVYACVYTYMCASVGNVYLTRHIFKNRYER